MEDIVSFYALTSVITFSLQELYSSIDYREPENMNELI